MQHQLPQDQEQKLKIPHQGITIQNIQGHFGNKEDNDRYRLKEIVGIQVVAIRLGYSVLTAKDMGTMQTRAIGLEDTDEEIDEQELEAHYSYMAKIQEVSPEESSSTGQPLEQVQNHDESNVYDNVRRHSEQPESINDTYVLEKDDSNVTPEIPSNI
ncbi:hypothetical protein Tco_1132159 [Tanacetum coccineum]|uniref:Uncharacterized protein n=1 Tax=Tanacetum coccineum TaxID=301880 RepID=A0ABQ5JE31_9ASTR